MDGTETSEAAGRTPYGAPLFQDPMARDLARVGVVDIGSNSVRMVVFDGAARSPAYFFNEKVLCGLGAGLSETGKLNPEGKTRAMAALRRFRLLADEMDLPPLTVVATAAMRSASDGPSFRDEIEAQTGLQVHVIDGLEEARLSAQGVLLGWPGSYGLVCDIGGSSMELAEVHGGEVGRCMTSDLGPLKLQDMAGRSERSKYIRSVLDDLKSGMGSQRDRLFLVGGSWRAIARIDMERLGYPLHVLHEYRMDAKAVDKTLAYLADCDDLTKLRKRCGISEQRMALVPLASEVLAPLVDAFDPVDIAVSSYGIREGLLYEQMPQQLRDRDPLIESCRFAERKDARNPGYGSRLFDFVRPLFPQASTARLRLVRAACLLHDVSWRAHPDYRAEVCFDYATRSNLGGLKHPERLWLGLALMHRYKNKRGNTRFEPLFDLLDDEALESASILGRAMRFGAMLWSIGGTPPGAEMRWTPDARTLELRMSRASAPLFGEVAENRFAALAQALNASEYRIVEV